MNQQSLASEFKYIELPVMPVINSDTLVIFVSAGFSADKAPAELKNTISEGEGKLNRQNVYVLHVKYTELTRKLQKDADATGKKEGDAAKLRLEDSLYQSIGQEIALYCAGIKYRYLLVFKSAGGPCGYYAASLSTDRCIGLGLQAPAPGPVYKPLQMKVFLGWQKCDTRVAYADHYLPLCEKLRSESFKSRDVYEGDNHVLQLKFIVDVIEYCCYEMF